MDDFFLNEFILILIVYYITEFIQVILTFYVLINQFKTRKMPKNCYSKNI